MRKVLVTAVLAAALVHPAIALAQDYGTPAPEARTNPTPADVDSNQTIFRGIRLEGNVGWDRFKAQGDHDSQLGYGGTVGFDGQYKRFVVGAEGSYWRGKDHDPLCSGISATEVCRSSYNEWGAAVRAGYLVTPELLVFGKGGYVNNRQRLDTAFGTSKDNTGGYQYGGGVEYSVPVMNMPVYVSAQYVRSEYDNGTSRQRVMGGVGIRFR